MVPRLTIPEARSAALATRGTTITASTRRAVEPRTTTPRRTRAARERLSRKRTAISPDAAAIRSSTVNITRAAERSPIVRTTPTRYAATGSCMIAFSGRTQVAANGPCMIPVRASAAVESYIATRMNLIPKNVAAATSTRPTMRYVVASARAFTSPNLQLSIRPTTPNLQLSNRPGTPNLQPPIHLTAPNLQLAIHLTAPNLQLSIHPATPKPQPSIQLTAPNQQPYIHLTLPSRVTNEEPRRFLCLSISNRAYLIIIPLGLFT